MFWTRSARRTAILLGAILGAAACLAPGTAGARALRPPKWLKGPYQRYALSFVAGATMQGTETRKTAGDGPDDPCDASTEVGQGSETSQLRLTYSLIFGHSKRGFAFVWKRAADHIGGNATWTRDFSLPPVCSADLNSHETCTAPLQIQERRRWSSG